jgi:uncharacterized RDD family membrane protein YckC
MAWYYKDGELEIGPVGKPELQDLLKKKVINGKTLIRSANSQEWKLLAEMVSAGKSNAQAQQPPSPPGAGPAGSSSMAMADDTSGEPDGRTPQPLAVCSQCGRSFPGDQVIEFEGQVICAACKPMFVQRLKEGVIVPARHQYAGFWIRLAAKMIDGLILSLATWGVMIPFQLFFFTQFTRNTDTFNPAMFLGAMSIMMLLVFGIQAFYTTWFVGRFAATPGKMACRLKVVLPDNGKVSYPRAFGRYCAELITSMTLTIGYIIAAFDVEKRSLHDRICSTRVVHK